MPKRLSFQLYSARLHDSLPQVLAHLANVGYCEVEGYGGVYDKPEKLRANLDKLGLTMPTGHFSIEMLESDRKAVLATASALGMRRIYAPYIPPEARPKNAAGWRTLGKRLAVIGEWARGEGYGFGWHNHDFEHQALPSGEYPLDIMFAAAPLLDWECDVAWIVRAKANPVTWIKRYADRITAAHIKDIAQKGQALDEDGWADVGTGKIKWPDVLKALGATRNLHLIIEHDKPSDVMRFAKVSYENLARL